MNEDKKQLLDYRGRIVSIIIALLLVVVFLFWGFGEAVVVAIIFAVGYLVGRQLDGHRDIQVWTQKTLRYFTERR
ncbi:DUF2273 domain-containing protein [Sinobaca sp. H24]|uniref:DUF2273 domain-containing protein n=1 Tax=Sinobaca sp. H24 TaxID=2923376 RepID=UPI00207A8CA6|nr:DUF2273 domain-containing protein [Sinobaca sp. H24]